MEIHEYCSGKHLESLAQKYIYGNKEVKVKSEEKYPDIFKHQISIMDSIRRVQEGQSVREFPLSNVKVEKINSRKIVVEIETEVKDYIEQNRSARFETRWDWDTSFHYRVFYSDSIEKKK